MKKENEEYDEKVKKEKIKFHVKYIKGELSEKEVDEYLESKDYLEMNKIYEKYLREERKEEMSKLLSRIQKDGLDVGELGSYKSIRKRLKEKDSITEKQLYWFINRIEYDVKVKEFPCLNNSNYHIIFV